MKIPFPCAVIEVSNDLESHRKDYTSIKTKMINNLNLAMQIVTCLRTEGISLEMYPELLLFFGRCLS